MQGPDRDEPAEREQPRALGPFLITGLLGQGGSATVWAARRGDEDVALKVPLEKELSPKEQERFLEEAKMLARVQHHSIVEVLDSGRLPDGQPFLLMRRYEGETLGDHVGRLGPLPFALALELFDQLASAVSALHAAGLLHRDLKPENVLLTDGARRVKLLDFGIAKDMDAPASTTTQAGIARGTPATMAPERFFGAPATRSTDVYELAVILYTMLVGRLPWTDVTNVNARLNPASPDEARPEVPRALAQTVMSALSTRPERRPASVDELAAAVRECGRGVAAATGRVTAATSVSEPPPALVTGSAVAAGPSEEAQVMESARRPLRRRSTLVVGAMATGIAGVALAAGVGLVRTWSSAAAPSAAPSAAAVLGPELPSPAGATLPEPSAALANPVPSAGASASAAEPALRFGPARRGAAPASASGKPADPPAPKPAGKPKGAPCTRSSECASMVCAADTCQ